MSNEAQGVEETTNGEVRPEGQQQAELSDANNQGQKLIPQSRLDKITGAIRHEGYQTGYEAAVKEFQEKQASQPAQKPVTDEQIAQHAAQSGLTEEKIRQLISEQTKQEREQHANHMVKQKVIDEMSPKIEEGVGKYDDYVDVVTKLRFDEDFGRIAAFNTVDNVADVAYHIAKNPSLRHQFKQMCKTGYDDAVDMVRQMSQSIKRNEQALSDNSSPHAPIGRIRPSATVDSSEATISDLKGKSWAKW